MRKGKLGETCPVAVSPAYGTPVLAVGRHPRRTFARWHMPAAGQAGIAGTVSRGVVRQLQVQLDDQTFEAGTKYAQPVVTKAIPPSEVDQVRKAAPGCSNRRALRCQPSRPFYRQP